MTTFQNSFTCLRQRFGNGFHNGSGKSGVTQKACPCKVQGSGATGLLTVTGECKKKNGQRGSGTGMSDDVRAPPPRNTEQGAEHGMVLELLRGDAQPVRTMPILVAL